MLVKLTGTLSLVFFFFVFFLFFFFFCQTEGASMLRNELVHKEMVECNQTSKSKEQKHKNKGLS